MSWELIWARRALRDAGGLDRRMRARFTRDTEAHAIRIHRILPRGEAYR